METKTEPLAQIEEWFAKHPPEWVRKEIPPPIEIPSTDHMLDAFRAVGFALSARALLLLAIVGAFVLAVFSMEGAKDGVWVLGTYCVLVILPIVFLETFKRR